MFKLIFSHLIYDWLKIIHEERLKYVLNKIWEDDLKKWIIFRAIWFHEILKKYFNVKF